MREVSLTIGPGSFFTLLGPSGSGKTTTLMMIAGFVAPTRGEIFLTALRRITLPLIAPGILSAALFAFLTSFDELLILLFLSGVEAQTLTVRIWNSLQLEVDPTIAAVSSFLIGVTTAILGASVLLRRGGEAGPP